ncbi:GNAT family N-acetyltransferase [Clavibacter tessellarius]|uniref:GNAT family N-acetyltransferase n=1 Tax=Clavibacter tessellarius TaxID=31965 RepID=UPI003251F1B2
MALTDVVNRAQSHDLGHDAFVWLPQELIADYADVAHVRKRLFAARVDGRIVGRGLVSTWLNDPATSDVAVSVLPEHRGRGIGRTLRERVERIALDDGCRTLTGSTMHRAEPVGTPIPSPTGIGAVGADDPAARFVVAAGYRLGQTARTSLARHPGRGPDARRAPRGRPPRGRGRLPGRLLGRRDPGAPPRRPRRAAHAHVDRHAGGRPPAGGGPVGRRASPRGRGPPRVLRPHGPHDGGRARGDGTPRGLHGDRRLPSGRRSDGHEYTYQQDTLVLAEHRGHRLGMLLKVENLLLLAREAPGADRVVTWNADENRPMLAVNEALGFRHVGTSGSWLREVGQER